MNASPATTGAAKPGTALRIARAWLKIDLLLCTLVLVSAMLAWAMLPGLEPGSADAVQAWMDGISGVAVALTGISGNLLLLRGRRVGLWLGLASLLCVAMRLVGLVWLGHWMLSNPEMLDCEPGVFIAGMAMGGIARLCLALFHGWALLTVARALRPALPAEPAAPRSTE
ncbi:hypothetical protein [Luteimonas sp. e5]